MKNWKTTLAGLIGLLVTVATPYFVPGAVIDYKLLGISLTLAAVGYLAKDAGTPPNAPTVAG